MFENKKIFVLGMARSGYEVAKLLASNNTILITDMKDQEEEQVKELESLKVKVVITEDPVSLLDGTYNYVVKNPGIKNDHPLVIKAKELNIKVINEVEVAYHLLPSNTTIIGITGSNGKTTTTTIIYEILKNGNDNVYLAGNIGIPLSKVIKDMKPNGILVIEISDHQLCNMDEFKTNTSILTNLSETHLDFHDTYDTYKAMKKRIFKHHTKDNLAIINLDNADSISLTNDINSTKKYFSSQKEADCYLLDNNIYYHNELVISTNDIKIKGKHNYENIMASIITCKHYGATNEVIKDVLKEFNGVEHRIEYVRSVSDITFYNDAKATNTVSTITALSSFNTPIILILGGLDRNHPFEPLIPYLKDVKMIVCYGETKNRIKTFCEENNITCNVVDTLKEATLLSYDKALAKDTVLLSPACASWDQYKCFEDRGNEFKEIVNHLERKQI